MTDTTPVPPGPSREAVETFTPSNGAMICCAQGTGHYVKTEDYRTLLAEVERLTGEGGSILGWHMEGETRIFDCRLFSGGTTGFVKREDHDAVRATVAQLERTVADQAAALAEVDKRLDDSVSLLRHFCGSEWGEPLKELRPSFIIAAIHHLAGARDSYQAALAERDKDATTAWLIERVVRNTHSGPKQAMWWTGTGVDLLDESAWTIDSNNAIKIASIGEATVLLMMLYRETKRDHPYVKKDFTEKFKATEHCWFDAALAANVSSASEEGK